MSRYTEPPLSDKELRVVRGLIDEYEHDKYRRAFFASGWRVVVAVVGVLGALAVLAAAIDQLIRGG